MICFVNESVHIPPLTLRHTTLVPASATLRVATTSTSSSSARRFDGEHRLNEAVLTKVVVPLVREMLSLG